MGRLARALGPVVNVVANQVAAAPLLVNQWQNGRPQSMEANFGAYAREGYAGNELVFICIEERAKTAVEPRILAKVRGEWVSDHPILTLLRNPNPWMDQTEFLKNVIRHRDLAGNTYALKVRSRAQRVVELWLLRPDQIKVVPHRDSYISHYELDLGGGEVAKIAVTDVVHWKTGNPTNQFYGQPPLMAASGRVDVDNYMRAFVKAYFENAGVPGGVLGVDGALSDEARKEIRARANDQTSGPSGWHRWLVIDKAKVSFTPVTSTLGSSGLVVPDLEKITTRRICAVFGVPPALVGVDDANTSYASMDVVERHFWRTTVKGMYDDLQGPLNAGPKRYANQVQIGLTPDFPDVEELKFDLSSVLALQEDVDKVAARERADLMASGLTIEEFRVRRGYGEIPDSGTFLVPSNFVPVAAGEVKAGRINLQDVRQAPTAPGLGPSEANDGDEAPNAVGG